MIAGIDTRSGAYPQRQGVERLRPATALPGRAGATDCPVGRGTGPHRKGEQWQRK